MDKPTSRFLSLDVFRGMAIAMMILVNNPGSESYIYAPLDHARWFGCTPTDLVFPFFLFAVGNSMSFAMKKYEELGEGAFLRKVFQRTILIILISYIVHFFPFISYSAQAGWGTRFDFTHMRIMGVLQRIALAYCAASLIIHYFKPGRAAFMAVFLLLVYWIILIGFGQPGHPLSLSGNAVLKLDRFLFSDQHLYHGEGVPFDPEGLLSTIPAISSVLFGYLAGAFVQQKGKNVESTAMLLLAGNLLIGAAYCWNLVFPISKKLWTSSFVLYSTGIALVILAILIYLVEIKVWTRWTKLFTPFGKNPLSIYILSDLVVLTYFSIPMHPGKNFYGWFYLTVFKPLAGPWNGSLLFALFHVLIFWMVAWYLDKKKIYFRV
ncbi:MAG: acyltransferase family protein [Chitinophagaceae bacterium]